MANYHDVFAKSVENPEGFWAEAAEGIDWYQKWDKVLDDSNPPFYRWFSGATMNTCYNAVMSRAAGETRSPLSTTARLPIRSPR